jgi:hypothetical protein
MAAGCLSMNGTTTTTTNTTTVVLVVVLSGVPNPNPNCRQYPSAAGGGGGEGDEQYLCCVCLWAPTRGICRAMYAHGMYAQPSLGKASTLLTSDCSPGAERGLEQSAKRLVRTKVRVTLTPLGLCFYIPCALRQITHLLLWLQQVKQDTDTRCSTTLQTAL